MALNISQILSASYPQVLAKVRGAENQWAESAFLRELERQGGVKRQSLGPTIECPLDYKRNPGAGVQASELAGFATTKTEILTAASYTPAEIVVPMTWSNLDEVMNPSENQKINLVKQIAMNAITSHDDVLEQALFATSTNGLLGLRTHVVDAGTGSDGGTDSSVETWWRNQQATYVDDTDIEAAFTTVWNACAKGSGSQLQPSLMVSDAATQAIFEGTQQPNQRYVDTQDLKAGFKTIAFKTARYVFSPYGSTWVAFMNAQNFNVVASKEYFRDKRAPMPLEGQTGTRSILYSALQTVTNNRSRLGVAHL
jgi:hypothetical protein